MQDLLCLERGSAAWPPGLDRVEAPPRRLWLSGRPELLGRPPGLAIVGSRAATPYGRVQAARFAEAGVRAGMTIISGLARGVDEAAHHAALEAGGETIAFLGCGVDRPWPDGPLARRMSEEGLLVSEHPPGQGPRRHHFPLRNRLIAGLAEAVLVVEAAQASGSLITARWALGQGKPVYSLPGRVDNPLARGTHGLIRDGAVPVGSPEELLSDLGGGPAGDAPLHEPHPSHPLLRALQGETAGVAELAELTGEDVDCILAELAELELSGSVVRTPGGLYRLGRTTSG